MDLGCWGDFLEVMAELGWQEQRGGTMRQLGRHEGGSWDSIPRRTSSQICLCAESSHSSVWGGRQSPECQGWG